MDYSDKLTKNIIFGESWSTKVINGKEVKRQIPPEEKYIPDVLLTAQDTQIVRNRLNEEYGNDPKIGYRNKLNEIMAIINSFWRQTAFQNYLYKKKQTTADGYKKISGHQKGTAVDLANPKGMTSKQFMDFIKTKCKTRFTYFKLYTWGVHCERR